MSIYYIMMRIIQSLTCSSIAPDIYVVIFDSSDLLC